MADFILLMHNDTAAPLSSDDWGPYIARLQAAGAFEGGSAIGEGVCVRKVGPVPPVSASLGGYMRISAGDLVEARALLAGNPVFEAGGTIEIRELPRTE
jgi:hypothetical protein